jgi:hypothetical protein
LYARVVTNQIQAGKIDAWQIAKLGAVLASPPVREAYELTVVA